MNLSIIPQTNLYVDWTKLLIEKKEREWKDLKVLEILLVPKLEESGKFTSRERAFLHLKLQVQ